MNYWHLRRAAYTVAEGGIIAYPTEAVWGFGCDPFSKDAVLRLLQIKQRPVSKGLILVASSVSQLGPLLKNLSDSERLLIDKKYAHPVTWLIPDEDNLIPSYIKGNHSEVAIRVSAHQQVKKLCDYWGGLLVSTSANRSTEPPAMSATEVRKTFQQSVDFILPGALGGYEKPSEIRSLRGDRILRSGQ